MRSLQPKGALLGALVLLFSVAGGVSGSFAEEIVYQGDYPYADGELDRILGIAHTRTATEAEIAAAMPRLVERLVSDGYLDAVIELARADEGVIVDVRAGRRVTASTPAIVGAPAELRSTVGDAIAIVGGGPLQAHDLERGLERVAVSLAEAGHPFAEVRAIDFARDGGRLAYRVQVTPGPIVVMDSLNIGGLKVTRPATAEKIAGFGRGERYRERQRDDIRLRLLRSGLFSQVGDVALRVLPDGKTGVYALTVEEAPSTLVHGVVGVGGQGKEVTGLVDVAITNLFGTARAFKVVWEGRGHGRAFYQIAFREPWIMGWPLAASGGFRQEQEGEAFTRTDWTGELELSLTDRLGVRMGWQSHESVSPVGDPRRSTRRSSRFGFLWDNRDHPFVPRRGGKIDLTATRGDQKDYLREGLVTKRPVTTLEALVEEIPLAGRWHAIHVGMRGYLREAKGEAVRAEDLYAVGGAETLRGYEERRFRTGRAALFSIEGRRYLRHDGSRAFLFLDVGYLDPARSLGTGGDRWKLGAGVGLRIASRVGLVGIDFAASEEIASYEEIRVHFSVRGRY